MSPDVAEQLAVTGTVWVVVAIACSSCNRTCIAVFLQQPTKEQIDKVTHDAGGMWCIRTEVVQAASDGETVELEQVW